MLCIYQTISALHECGTDIITLDEGFVSSAIDWIKELFRRMKRMLFDFYRMIFGSEYGAYQVDRFTISFGSGRSRGSYSPDGWTKQNSADVRAKLRNDYFIRNFEWELHDWNNRYLDTMSDRITKMDNVRFRMPNGSLVNSSAYAVAREIKDLIQDYHLGKSPRRYRDLLSSFKDEINRALERIYDIPDGISYKELIPKKICSETITTRTLTYNDAQYMLTSVETTSDIKSRIEQSYKNLMDEINVADREIQSLQTDDLSPELSEIITALTQALQYKLSVLTSLEHIHIRAIDSRSSEFRKELRRFNNM